VDRAGHNVEPRALGSASEYLKGLAELAKSLNGLTPAIAAFLIVTILFLSLELL
jgi:hypothetical protein